MPFTINSGKPLLRIVTGKRFLCTYTALTWSFWRIIPQRIAEVGRIIVERHIRTLPRMHHRIITPPSPHSWIILTEVRRIVIPKLPLYFRVCLHSVETVAICQRTAVICSPRLGHAEWVLVGVSFYIRVVVPSTRCGCHLPVTEYHANVTEVVG